MQRARSHAQRGGEERPEGVEVDNCPPRPAAEVGVFAAVGLGLARHLCAVRPREGQVVEQAKIQRAEIVRVGGVGFGRGDCVGEFGDGGGSVPVWSKAGMLLRGNSEVRVAWRLANGPPRTAVAFA